MALPSIRLSLSTSDCNLPTSFQLEGFSSYNFDGEKDFHFQSFLERTPRGVKYIACPVAVHTSPGGCGSDFQSLALTPGSGQTTLSPTLSRLTLIEHGMANIILIL